MKIKWMKIGARATIMACMLCVPAYASTDNPPDEVTIEDDVQITEEVKVREVVKPVKTKCRMTFNLKSWSAFYKRSKGNGVITCDNGQRADVKISAHGGGVTFGKSEITGGHGSFTKVYDISELFGSYAASEAHAGVKKSSDAQAMTKGKISLSLAGTGKGYDLGFAFGSFKITQLPSNVVGE